MIIRKSAGGLVMAQFKQYVSMFFACLKKITKDFKIACLRA